MSDLLLIDEDPGQLVTQVRQAFPAPDHRIAVARTGVEGVAHVRAAAPDVVRLNTETFRHQACDVQPERGAGRASRRLTHKRAR
jgi:hypothetical protein